MFFCVCLFISFNSFSLMKFSLMKHGCILFLFMIDILISHTYCFYVIIYILAIKFIFQNMVPQSEHSTLATFFLTFRLPCLWHFVILCFLWLCQQLCLQLSYSACFKGRDSFLGWNLCFSNTPDWIYDFSYSDILYRIEYSEQKCKCVYR